MPRIVFEDYVTGSYASDKELAAVTKKVISDFESWKRISKSNIISVKQNEFRGPTHDPYDGKWGYKIDVLYE